MRGYYYKTKSVIHKKLSAFEEEAENLRESVSALELAVECNNEYEDGFLEAYRDTAAYFRRAYDNATEETERLASLERAVKFSRRALLPRSEDVVNKIFYYFDRGRLLLNHKNYLEACRVCQKGVDLIAGLKDVYKSKEVERFKQFFNQTLAEALKQYTETQRDSEEGLIADAKRVLSGRCLELKVKIERLAAAFEQSSDPAVLQQIDTQRKGIVRANQLCHAGLYEHAKPKLERILGFLKAIDSENCADSRSCHVAEFSQMFPEPDERGHERRVQKRRRYKANRRKARLDEAKDTEPAPEIIPPQGRLCRIV